MPDGLQSRQFGERDRQGAKTCDLVMRQRHRAGETLFVDSAGQTMPVVNPHTGETHDASIFLAVLGASNSTFAEATWSQNLSAWIGSHVRAFEALGGGPRVLVPDNLQAAVNRAQRDEPDLNRTYVDRAQPYGVAMVPTSIARPRDTAKVEGAVQVVERWLLARLRHHTFFSLAALNTALKDLRDALNHRPFNKRPGSRQRLCASLDRPALGALPDNPDDYAEGKLVRAGIDYHVEVAGHYYSVPYTLGKHQLEARLSARPLEGFHKGKPDCLTLALTAQGTSHHGSWPICQKPTNALPSGPHNGSSGGLRNPARQAPGESKPFSPPVPILSRGVGRLSAACAWANNTAPSALKPPVSAP